MLDNAGNMLWAIGAIVLAMSALAAQRMSLGFAIKAALTWAAIIFVVVLAVSHRYEMQAMFSGVTQALGIDEQQVSGGTVRIRMSPDGHFWARVKLNGVDHMMLIDSGATYTAISDRTAQAAGIEPGRTTVQLNTANGVVEAKRARIELLDVGPLQTRDLGVVVSPAFGDTDVLGMNFLSRLGSWRVEGRTLILEPGKGGEASTEDQE
jgi:aspartyl protease family protein